MEEPNTQTIIGDTIAANSSQYVYIDKSWLQSAGSVYNANEVKAIKNLNGKYIKLLLSRLETQFDISKDMRKTVLDTMNDYARELYEVLNI